MFGAQQVNRLLFKCGYYTRLAPDRANAYVFYSIKTVIIKLKVHLLFVFVFKTNLSAIVKSNSTTNKIAK